MLNKAKKKFSLLMTLMLVLGMMPMSAFADEEDAGNIAAADITGTDDSDTKEQLADYLNSMFTFSDGDTGTISWDDGTKTLAVTGYTVAHDKDSETDKDSSAWTIWTGRIMDGFTLDLSDVTEFILAEGSWLHVQSTVELKLPDEITLGEGAVITKDVTSDESIAWGYKPEGTSKYFKVLAGNLPEYSYEENVTGYPAPVMPEEYGFSVNKSDDVTVTIMDETGDEIEKSEPEKTITVKAEVTDDEKVVAYFSVGTSNASGMVEFVLTKIAGDLYTESVTYTFVMPNQYAFIDVRTVLEIKKDLDKIVEEASIEKMKAVVSVNGSDVLPSQKWVTQAAMDAFLTVYKDATDVLYENDDATEDEINQATEALTAALTTFKAAQKSGTKVSPPSSGGGGGGGSSSVRPDSNKDTKKDEPTAPEATTPESGTNTGATTVQTVIAIGQNTAAITENGVQRQITMDVPPMIQEGRTMMPARFVADVLGVGVAYDNSTKAATFTYEDAAVVLVLGQKTMTVNGQTVELQTAPLLVNGRVLLPLRDIQQAFAGLGLNATIDWDSATKSVTIEKQ